VLIQISQSSSTTATTYQSFFTSTHT
jgi:hypothetical protein